MRGVFFFLAASPLSSKFPRLNPTGRLTKAGCGVVFFSQVAVSPIHRHLLGSMYDSFSCGCHDRSGEGWLDFSKEYAGVCVMAICLPLPSPNDNCL